jgi:acetyltransferase-like isoleucine patch superfamily enzyme
MGNDCFLGNGVSLDLAAPITLGNQVTLAERVCVLTHLNVGYKDHPLQTRFPSRARETKIENGCFLGVGTVVLDGLTIGSESFVAACSLVRDSVPAKSLVGGVPAKPLAN